MARPRKSASQHNFTPGQAKYVLERLIKDHRISASDVRGYVDEMRSEIGVLEERLRSLREAAGEAIRSAVQALTPRRRRGRPPGSGAKAPAAAKPRAKRRRRARITPEQLASRQLQGRYLGLIRQIPASRRGQYQKIAKERGREAAIKEMSAVLHK
ncbi:MAG: hypothetical protein ACXWHG_10435 [Thermoanaerobaculia bacterium]